MAGQIRNTVVVGVDGTADGERAIWYGAALAAREDLDLRLVHVPHEIAFYAPMMPHLPVTTIREIGESVLQEAAKHAEEAGLQPSRTSTVLSEGSRTAALLRHVQDARHIVLGSRTSTVEHLLSGTTTLSVVAHSSVPVHCVPRTWWTERAPSGRLVVGVDGSRADPDVLHEAFAEAATRGAGLDIIHAWRPVSPYDAAVFGRVLEADWEKAARNALTGRIEKAAAGRPAVHWSLQLRFERVPVAVHEAAVGADLLILGRHGHNPPLGLLVGSNTRTLLRTATCPVVVIPVRSEEQ